MVAKLVNASLLRLHSHSLPTIWSGVTSCVSVPGTSGRAVSGYSCHSRHRQIDSCASTVLGWCGGSLRFRGARAGGLQCPMRCVRGREVKPAAVGADVWVGFAGSRKLGNAIPTILSEQKLQTFSRLVLELCSGTRYGLIHK